MDFQELYTRILPKLNWLAKKHDYGNASIGRDDLLQEMCTYLWAHYKDGLPESVNEAYVARGCEFHILNYLRLRKQKTCFLSLDQPVGEEGFTLGDTLESGEEPLDRVVDKRITIDVIRNNGFTPREKEVFSLLLEGYTTRETGKRLGISHVMVVKLRKNLIKRWRSKEDRLRPVPNS